VTDDRTIRFALLVVALAVLPIGIYHRVQSQATRESLDRRQEGLFILATLRPIGVVLWLGVIAYMINPAWMAWSSMPLPAWLRWTGLAACAVGGGLMVWTFRRLGKNLTDTVVTRRNHTLVTNGPYHFVRHPFYVSGALFALGTSFVAANWFLFTGGVLFIGLIIIRTRIEEEHLLTRFGDRYRTYMEQTGRFVPRLRTR
jgi:protein-S-isoprenylcysteine O-methyltransferase Ste14